MKKERAGAQEGKSGKKKETPKITGFRVLEEIAEGKIYPVYLLYGPEEYIAERIVKSLREQVFSSAADAAGAREIDYEVWEGEKCSPGEVLAAAQSPPWLGPRRMIVVREASWFKGAGEEKEAAHWEEYLRQPMPSTVLVITAGSEAERRNRLFRCVEASAHAVAVECGELGERERRAWLKQRSKELGLQLISEAAEYLLAFGGKRLQGLENELQKLASYAVLEEAAPPFSISLEIVKKVCTREVEGRIFEVIDAVAAGEKFKAVSLCRELLGAGVPAPRLFYLLVRHYRLLHRVLQGQLRGGGEAELASELKMPQWLLRKYLTQASRLPLSDVHRGLQLMLELDVEMKTGQKPLEIGLELLLTEL